MFSVRGVRGATTARANTADAIAGATIELLQRMMADNGVEPESIASIIFSVSDDLNAAFPAEAARQLGLHRVPLLCTREISVPGSLPRCIRVLMHVNTPLAQEAIQHVYLHEAQSLRPDLPATASGTARADGPLPRAAVSAIDPYVPSMTINEIQQRLGLTDVIKLGSNENPLGPSPNARRRVAEALDSLHEYPDGPARRLRQALAQRFALTEEHLIVGNGSDALIKLIAEAFLEPGDDVICARPTFSQYAFAASLMGARVQYVPLTADMRHDLGAMTERVGPRTKAVFVCNPNNPTGTAVTRGEFETFLAQLPPHVLVVVDEAYAEYARPDVVSGADTVRRGDRRVIVLRTFSKIYGLAALRVGYAMAHPQLIDTLRRVQEPYQVNMLAQLAAEAALADEDHIRRSLAMNEAGKRYFYARLEKLGLSYIPTETNFVFFDVRRPSREVAAQLMEQGVVVRAGESFGQPTFVRATIGTEEQNQRLFEALARVLSGSVAPAAAGMGARGKEEAAQ